MANFKINDFVTSKRFGTGMVTEIDNDEEYPITCRFMDETEATFTADGCFEITDEEADLTLNN